ncbi:hypothetical protein OXPF_12230 [Oxobacter pfennigii]|uniref:Bacterial Pleckstrin homology domain-containing protein n=1 Tax=Oxobacter pfennigii TaxID=36849 RepID=A0A0P8WC71_9CLOT|nr:PH domain-containing protein [Oxobacter pfennigii]KPU45330.1 hypothetical protein OXPF_12230 [Oxobacter pfennigii]
MKKKNRTGKLSLVILGIVTVIFLVLANKGIDIKYVVSNGSINISWFGETKIPIKDIVEIRLLDELPQMEKVKGVEFFNLRQGTFFIEGIGKVKVYSPDIRKKMVLIKTPVMTYGVTPENAKEFISYIDMN